MRVFKTMFTLNTFFQLLRAQRRQSQQQQLHQLPTSTSQVCFHNNIITACEKLVPVYSFCLLCLAFIFTQPYCTQNGQNSMEFWPF